MNDLKYLEDFEAALKDYRLSVEARSLLNDMRLVLLVAPSSSGRNTIIRELLKTKKYHFIVSDTTRNPRTNDGVPEKDGQAYWFRDEKQVLEDIRSGHFLEAAVIHKQQVSGISIRELRKAHDDQKIAITDVEPVGASNIQHLKPDTTIIFVVPPSFPVWIERLHHRGILPEEEVRRRLESAVQEYESALQESFYTYVVNDRLEDSVRTIHDISVGRRDSTIQQAEAKELIKRLIDDTKSYLSS